MTRDMTHFYICTGTGIRVLERGYSKRVTRPIHIWDIIKSWRDSFLHMYRHRHPSTQRWLLYACSMTHTYVRHDSWHTNIYRHRHPSTQRWLLYTSKSPRVSNSRKSDSQLSRFFDDWSGVFNDWYVHACIAFVCMYVYLTFYKCSSRDFL